MSRFSPGLAFKALWQMRVRRRPFVLSHGITLRCNLKCRFCEYWSQVLDPTTTQSSGKPREGSDPLLKEMTTDEVLSMLDDASAFGIGVYNAWSAEPLMREDLPRILYHAKRLGLVTSLITNGRLLSRRLPELSSLDLLSVSIDGIKSYKSLRGIDVDEAMQGIRSARSYGFRLLLNCVISRKNLSELEDLVNLAKEIGASISFEPLHESKEIDGKVWEELGIRDDAAYKAAIDRLIELKGHGGPIINSKTYLRMIRDRNPAFNCHSSDIILHVAADGTIQHCRVHKEPLGKVQEGIENIWRETTGKRHDTAERCEGCLFFGYAENSMLYEFVPEVMAHYDWM